MARDKLITIRIEGDKREAFNQLAKSQNSDTASLLYDFISGCLDGRIDIKLVTGKGQRIDNQIDSDRIDKLEATTQRIDNWIGALSERLNDWILRSDQRLTDCEKELSEKMVSLEHRLNALAIQWDSQQIDSIDTDSQQIDDMEPLIKKALRLDFMDDQSLIDAIERQIEDTEIDESDYEPETSPLPIIEETVEATIETVEAVTDTVEAVTVKVESVYTVEPDSIDEPVTGSIGPAPGDSQQLKNQLVKAVTIKGLTNAQLHKKTRVPVSTIEKWKGKIKEGKEVTPRDYPDFFKQWRLNPTDSLWYEVD